VKKIIFNILSFCVIILLLTACSASKKSAKSINTPAKSTSASTAVNNKTKVFTKPLKINRYQLIDYAKTFKGTPYKYGSSTPKNGLDCSGFILVVFQHFGVKTPRVTKDYTNEGETIALKNAKPGDIILFTGSDNSTGIVGHMGIIITNNGTTEFIHSASGKNIGVIESKLAGYWLTHFVKVIRLLE
jgi:cell wall-associated NlpC family hydrolase